MIKNTSNFIHLFMKYQKNLSFPFGCNGKWKETISILTNISNKIIECFVSSLLEN